MESNLGKFTKFQIYSIDIINRMSTMVNCIWLEDNRIFFRVVDDMNLIEKYFKNEDSNDVYSINRDPLISIRCRLFF
ncbi:MAG: hypothetical protein ACFFEY_03230 [Candidatus Thorarchaeota archaeon]